MRTVGLITEYNPFHNGHQYHIEEAKRLTNSDHVIVIMSGNYVQRGTPAFLHKYARTNMALLLGADIVIELPVCYATSSAEFFALGAISILEGLGIVDSICFGSECGDIKLLSTIADILVHEPQELSDRIIFYTKEGLSYPKARSTALLEYMKSNQSLTDYDYEYLNTTLLSPNNILGIEYIKALKYLNSSMIPMTIARKDAGYHDEDLNHLISSATAIRKSLDEQNDLDVIRSHVPNQVYDILLKEYHKTFPILENDFSSLLKYKLLLTKPEEFSSYADVSGGLEMRIPNLLHEYKDFESFCLELKTKQLTLTRVSRALIHILLNITSDQLINFNQAGYCNYARILGFKKSSSYLLKAIKEQGCIPIILKVAQANKLLDETSLEMFRLDLFATELYNSIVYDKYKTSIPNEFIHGPVILP